MFLNAGASERHKGYAAHVKGFQFPVLLDKLPQTLIPARWANGDGDSAAFSQLFGQGRRKMIGRGSDHDRVERSVFGLAIVAVSLFYL
jgi:hypothetical protein